MKKVGIKAVNGKVMIEGWDESCAEVEYITHGEVNVEVEKPGDELIIKEEPKKKKILGIFEKSSNGWAEIRVKVPKGVVVSATNVNGTIEGREVEFKLVNSVNGRIILEKCMAGIISTVNAGIKASLSKAESLKVKTVNGPIKLTIEELEGNAVIGTVNGSVHLILTEFCDAKIKAKAINGSVRMIDTDTIGTGEYEVNVSTVNGSITIELI